MFNQHNPGYPPLGYVGFPLQHPAGVPLYTPQPIPYAFSHPVSHPQCMFPSTFPFQEMKKKPKHNNCNQCNCSKKKRNKTKKSKKYSEEEQDEEEEEAAIEKEIRAQEKANLKALQLSEELAKKLQEEEYQRAVEYMTCSRCCETKHCTEMEFLCENIHYFCKSCSIAYYTSVQKTNKYPTCPIEGCKQMIEFVYLKKIPEIAKEAEEFFTKMLLNDNLKYFKCPNGSCKQIYDLDKSSKFAVSCSCGMICCSRCSKFPYHYVPCDKVSELTGTWIAWQLEGRQSSKQQTAEQQKRREELEQRKKAYEADEANKEATCICCPHCNRVIEKIAGCDSMVCGQDAHGGNVQNGCARGFHYSQAAKYKRSQDNAGILAAIQQFQQAQAVKKNHGKTCHKCNNQIIGLMFSCINCNTSCEHGTLFCENCEEVGTKEHNVAVRGTSNNVEHVFMITK